MPVYNCINDKCDQNFTKPTSLLRHLNRRKYKSKGCDFPCCVTKDFNWICSHPHCGEEEAITDLKAVQDHLNSHIKKRKRVNESWDPRQGNNNYLIDQSSLDVFFGNDDENEEEEEGIPSTPLFPPSPPPSIPFSPLLVVEETSEDESDYDFPNKADIETSDEEKGSGSDDESGIGEDIEDYHEEIIESDIEFVCHATGEIQKNLSKKYNAELAKNKDHIKEKMELVNYIIRERVSYLGYERLS